VLVERESELAAVEAVVDAVARGRGQVLWIEGPAGIGKTRLLAAVREQADAARVRLLAARASELEREFSFGVVRSLFEPVVAGADEAGRSALLAGAARLAEPVVTLTGPTAEAGTAERLHGLYWLTANLADDGPLLLAIDDAQWADEPSLRTLAYLVRRIADLPVGLVVATRPELDADAARVATAVRAEPVTTVLRPAPLGRAGTARLVGHELGAASPEFCAACHDASDGNPLLLRTLLAALVADGVAPDESGVAVVHERAPAILATSVLTRLRRLPPAAAALARAVAVLGPDAELRHAAALAELHLDHAVELADALVAGGLFAPGRPLAFAHPLYGQVVADHMSAAERHHAHHLAARRLAAEGGEPERVAGHLLATERLGDPWVVAALRSAARDAAVKGAPAAAVTYLRRAMAEPPRPAVRGDVLLELGTVQVQVSATDGVEALSQALATASDARTVARIALVASRAARSMSDFRTADGFLAAVEDRLDELDADLRFAVEAEIVFVRWVTPAHRAAVVDRARSMAAQDRIKGAEGANVVLTVALDALHTDAASADRAAELALRAATLNAAQDAPALGVLAAAMSVLIALDRLDAAREALDRAIVDARRRGSLLQLGEALTFRAMLGHRCGRLADAEADVRVADRVAAQAAGPAARRWTAAGLARCLVERGELTEAEEILQAATGRGELSVLLEARGHLRSAQRRPQEAAADFLAAGTRAERQLSHPGLVEWRPAAALALRELGRGEQARRLVVEAIHLAQHFGVRRALGLALRARGLVEGSVDALGESVDVLASTGSRLEHARALVDLGAALRRANCRSDARTRLEDGMHLAHECGATALLARARTELAAAGARPRRPARRGPDALTPSERRIVELAAGGLGNREIAQALFVTTKTVETHLGAAYRKLGVSGRRGLAGAL
jgi:DNA-binding CsgD family transcriptional regulator/tetratricopeptide (TPR) repeat protein